MTKKYYPQVEANPNFPAIESKILSYWEEKQIFKKSVDSRKAKIDSNNNEFIFYDGPPFANGLPHYGHLLTGFIKDTYARYQTTKGKKVERRFGWDCHGLPAEMGAEKDLGISGRMAITEYGIDKFNNHCRLSVMKYTDEWEKYVTRQARWVDFKNSYKTMDNSFMESVMWAFKELDNKGLLYESMKVMPYSWACETPLSNFETRLDNSYRERADKAVTVSFIINEPNEYLPKNCDEYRILAWTTTPWTLPSNLALAVGEELDYAVIVKDNKCYILAKFAVEAYKNDLGFSDENIIYIKGKNLENLSYKPLFDYFANNPNSFKIFVADFVTEGDGTGIVHIAPGFGEDDQVLCENNGIALVCPVDNSGKFTNEVSDFEGLLVFDANDKIIIALKQKGNWHKTEQYIHNYPHCWRTDTPLIYKAVPSWYVKVTAFKERMVELNKQINWIPGHVKDGLFGKWLENARDWSISRKRFWGTPIPVWKSDNNKYPRIDVYGSIKELEEDFGVKVTDLHRPFIDSLTRPNPDDPTGKSMMRRVEDVFDCWFESGSMPYGQAHYPFENKQWFEEHFPADFIVEYSAQTRGWFYTLMVLSTALFDRPPFLNCICHGVILDASGQKLSKRLNNYADPMELFAKFGADAIRYTMLSSTVVRGQELLIDKEGKMVYDCLRLNIKPIWNAYNFFTLYANADGIKAEVNLLPSNILDKYILSKLKFAVQQIKFSLDNFDTQAAYIAMEEFFEILNNWYIRRSRQRFWKSEKDDDKISAYNTLYTCLDFMSRAISSLLPLISEEIYIGINGGLYDSEISVHLMDFPEVEKITFYSDLVKVMDMVRDICSSALFIRNKENARVRQPLSELTIIIKNYNEIESFEELIKDEINVKNVVIKSDVEQYAETKLVLNFQTLGKRLPAKIKDLIAASKQNNWQYQAGKLIVADIELLDGEFEIGLVPKIDKGSKALSTNEGLVILDLTITPELELEGIARDVIRAVQQARKDANLKISDRIVLDINASDKVLSSIDKFKQLIEQQTLATFNKIEESLYKTSVEIEDGKIDIKINKT